MIKKVLALGCALTLCVSCEPINGTPNPEPTTAPTNGTEAPSGDVASVPLINVTLEIQDQTGKKLPNATVILSSDNQDSLTVKTNEQGNVNFPELRSDTTYRINVQAQGYFDATRDANLGQLLKAGQKDVLLAIILEAPKTIYTGRVLNSQGQPIVNATIFDTRQSVLSDNNGNFELRYASSGNLRMAISKSGYQLFSQFIDVKATGQGNTETLGDFKLTASGQKVAVGIDSAHSDSTLLSRYSQMQTQLNALGYSVNTLTGNLLDKLQNIETLFILSPSQNFSLEEISAIQAFVLSGKKLIVTGEWGGFKSFSGVVANQLLLPFKLQFGVDILKQSNQVHMNVDVINEHPLTENVGQIKLYTTGTVRITAAEADAEIVVRSSEDSFRIASNNGSFGVVACSHFGAGKVVVLGDSSLWSDDDSDGNGNANFFEAGNARLLEQIMKW